MFLFYCIFFAAAAAASRVDLILMLRETHREVHSVLASTPAVRPANRLFSLGMSSGLLADWRKSVAVFDDGLSINAHTYSRAYGKEVGDWFRR